MTAQSHTSQKSAKKESLIEKVKKLMNGAGVGVLIGGVGAMLAGSHIADQLIAHAPDPEPADDAPDTSDEAPDADVQSRDLSGLVDGELPIASNVTDDMSFTEAYAAAREQVGPGGVFQWHNQLYGTYTRAEWNGMTQVERAEYGSHFSWDDIDALGSDVAIAVTGRRENRRPNNNNTPNEDQDNDRENEDSDAADSESDSEDEPDSDELDPQIISDTHPVPDAELEVVEVVEDNSIADTPGHDDFAGAFPESYPDLQNPCDQPNDPDLFPYDDPTGSDFADDGDYVNNANVDGFLS